MCKNKTLRLLILSSLKEENNETLVTSVILLAFSFYEKNDWATWIDLSPPGKSRDFLEQRAKELITLEKTQEGNPISKEVVKRGSNWLQLQMANSSTDVEIVSFLRSEGRTKRTRNAANQRFSQISQDWNMLKS